MIRSLSNGLAKNFKIYITFSIIFLILFYTAIYMGYYLDSSRTYWGAALIWVFYQCWSNARVATILVANPKSLEEALIEIEKGIEEKPRCVIGIQNWTIKMATNEVQNDDAGNVRTDMIMLEKISHQDCTSFKFNEWYD